MLVHFVHTESNELAEIVVRDAVSITLYQEFLALFLSVIREDGVTKDDVMLDVMDWTWAPLAREFMLATAGNGNQFSFALSIRLTLEECNDQICGIFERRKEFDLIAQQRSLRSGFDNFTRSH